MCKIVPKYRIKQIGYKYYPQKKYFLFWRNIKIYECSCIESDNSITLYGKYIHKSNNLEHVKKFIKDYKDLYLHPFFVKWHLVKTFYDWHNEKFYYVDTTTGFFSDCSETLCEKIMLYKQVNIINL